MSDIKKEEKMPMISATAPPAPATTVEEIVLSAQFQKLMLDQMQSMFSQVFEQRSNAEKTSQVPYQKASSTEQDNQESYVSPQNNNNPDDEFPQADQLLDWGYRSLATERGRLPNPKFSRYIQFLDQLNDSNDEETRELRAVRKRLQFDKGQKKNISAKDASSKPAPPKDSVVTSTNEVTTTTQLNSGKDEDGNEVYSDGDVVETSKHIFKDLHELRKTMFSNTKKKKKSKSNFDDSSDDSSDDEDEFQKLSASRRNSILGRIVKASTQKPKKPPNDPRRFIQYIQTPPKYDHIKLEKLTLKSVHKFMEQILAYTTATNGLELPVATLVSQSVRDHLMSFYKGLTLDKFYGMKTSQLLTILQMESRPKSHIAFYEELKKQTPFTELPKGYVPSALNFKIFYDAYILYKTNFIQYYDLMAEENEPNIPPNKNKEGGLIKLFIDRVPFNYGQTVFRSLVRANNGKEQFRDIKDFIHKFGTVIEDHYKKYEENRTIQEHFVYSHSSGSTGSSFNNGSSRFNNNRSFTNSTYNKFRNGSSLHHIDEHNGNDSNEDNPDNEDNLQHNVDHDMIPDANQPSDVDYVQQEQQSNNNTEEEDAEENHNRQMFQDQLDQLMYVDGKSNNYSKPQVNNSSKNQTPLGCLQMLLHDSCKKGDKCTFTHDPIVLQRSHNYYVDLLSKSKYKPRNSINSSFNVNSSARHANNQQNQKLLLTRPKPPPPRDSRAFHHVAQDPFAHTDVVSDKVVSISSTT
jgi:hypothetical protein